MTEPVDLPLPPPTSPKSKRQKKWLWIVTLLFLLVGLFFFICWRVWWRYEETTDDAYVNGNQIILTPQVSGIVTKIYVDNTQLVEEGQLILELDPHEYLLAFEEKKAELANSVREVAGMFLKVEEIACRGEALLQDVVQSALDYDHRLALVEDQSVSIEEFEHSETAFLKAYALFEENEKAYQIAWAQIENCTVPTHPKVERAQAAVRQAYLSLHRCSLLAPAKGIITQRKAQVGEHVSAQDPLMALVPIDQMWVDANFREVSLKNFRLDQPVELFSDMYGRDVVFKGRLVGLNPGTGSVFSVLPPQNATGNWIKIVQRVPVKISLTPEELIRYPLLLGLSMTVRVDTHQRAGWQLPESTCSKPIYTTEVYRDELEGVEEILLQIIKDNYTEKE